MFSPILSKGCIHSSALGDSFMPVRVLTEKKMQVGICYDGEKIASKPTNDGKPDLPTFQHSNLSNIPIIESFQLPFYILYVE